MANSWLRLWHDMPNDPKWRTIARGSGQSVSIVQSTYLQILISASMSDVRGSFTVTPEDIASAIDESDEAVQAVISAMQGRVIDGDRVTGWETRQPAREDGASGGNTPTANYIYYVGTTDNDVVKVGISRNPWSRVKDLQTGSSSKFELLATMKTESRSEFEIHAFFKETRTNGEWFRYSSALKSLISKTKDKELSTYSECIEYLSSLSVDEFVATTDNYRSGVVATKDKDKDKEEIKNTVRVKRESDPRHTPFKQACEKYYEHHKLEMAWSPSEGKQLSELLTANPSLTLPSFQDLLRNRSKSQVNHAERPRVWIARATDYAAGPLDKFKNPLGSAGPKATPPSPGNYSALEEIRERNRIAMEEKERQEAELANKAS